MRTMNKGKVVKFMTMGLAVMLAVGVMLQPISGARANAEQPIGKIKEELTNNLYDEEELKMIEQYMIFDEKTCSYTYEEELTDVVSSEELNVINDMLNDTNKSIKNIDVEAEEVTIVDNKNCNDIYKENITRKKYKEGKTKVETHWYGVKIFLSKKVVNEIGDGITVGTIWIPEALVSKLCTMLGFALGKCPGGIWFNLTAAQLAVLPVVPVVINFSFIPGVSCGFQ